MLTLNFVMLDDMPAYADEGRCCYVRINFTVRQACMHECVHIHKWSSSRLLAAGVVIWSSWCVLAAGVHEPVHMSMLC